MKRNRALSLVQIHLLSMLALGVGASGVVLFSLIVGKNQDGGGMPSLLHSLLPESGVQVADACRVPYEEDYREVMSSTRGADAFYSGCGGLF